METDRRPVGYEYLVKAAVSGGKRRLKVPPPPSGWPTETIGWFDTHYNKDGFPHNRKCNFTEHGESWQFLRRCIWGCFCFFLMDKHIYNDLKGGGLLCFYIHFVRYEVSIHISRVRPLQTPIQSKLMFTFSKWFKKVARQCGGNHLLVNLQSNMQPEWRLWKIEWNEKLVCVL